MNNNKMYRGQFTSINKGKKVITYVAKTVVAIFIVVVFGLTL